MTTPAKVSVTFIIPRTFQDELTFAIVTALVNPVHNTEYSFFNRLRDALTLWVTTTRSGQHAWRNSSEDFNVGDLSGYTEDPSLIAILRDHHIDNLCITTVSHSHPSTTWTFDDLLVNADALPTSLKSRPKWA